MKRSCRFGLRFRLNLLVAMVAFVVLSLTSEPDAEPQRVLTSTLTLTSANNGQTFTNYRISTTGGDCVDMNGASNVTFENSDIGPCAGRGIYINGGAGNNIYDSYIHVQGASTGCCDTRDGILLTGNSSVVQGNVVAYSEANIVNFGDDNVVTGNFLLNPQGLFPRGQQFQSPGGSNITFTNNFTVSTPDSTLGPAIGTANTAPILMSQDTTCNRPNDNVNFYETTGVLAENNYITGGLDATTPDSGGSQCPSGCGLIADYGTSSASFLNNILVNTGQTGINIANGTDQVVIGNKIITLNPNTGGNTADIVWNEYSPACGPVTESNNIATEIQASGNASSFWNGDGCGTVACPNGDTTLTDCNTFDEGGGRAAYDLLTPIATALPPPLIPPLPKNCVVKSPYSTQTSVSPCS
jgi:Right handed beta helix region